MANKYLDENGVQRLVSKLKTYITNAIKVTGVKGNSESSYRTGNVNLTAANVGAYEQKAYERGTLDVGMRPYINQARANRLAFLPANQIIVEKTTDGGETWESAGFADITKRLLFTELNVGGFSIPLLNNAKSTQCGLRVTITGMKYDVPDGTAETEKYNYWNSEHVLSQERYFNVREWWFWVSANNDTIKPEIYCATGAKPNNWVTVFNKDFRMTGRSGSDWIRAGDGKTFGGAISQTENYWNWRIIFWSRMVENKTEFQSATVQNISQVRCYGDLVWGQANALMAKDHMYTWDGDKNVTFPARVTATQFNGTATNASKVNNHTVNSDVPSNAKFTDTVTTATTSGNGNAVTAISASNGALTVTKGSTFLTSHQDISGKADKTDLDTLYNLKKGTEIPANTDLNTLTTAGVYYCSSTTNAESYDNCPVDNRGFKLVVMETGYNAPSYIIQTIHSGMNSGANGYVVEYTRTYGSSSGWTPWRMTPPINENLFQLFRGTTLYGETDLNNVTEIGSYFSASSSTTNGLSHCPVSNGGFTMHVDSMIGNDADYVRQRIYFKNEEYVRTRAGSSASWSNWYKTLVQQGPLATGTDLNDINSEGIWFLNGDYTYTNAPATYGLFEVLRPHTTGVTMQRLTTTGAIYYRYRAGSTWYSWKTVPTKDQVDAKTQVKSTTMTMTIGQSTDYTTHTASLPTINGTPISATTNSTMVVGISLNASQNKVSVICDKSNAAVTGSATITIYYI